MVCFFIKKRNDALIDLCIRKRVTYGSLSIRSPNKYAKITYGNKTSSGRGIKNLHLNIRSIRNKMSDIKHLIHKEKPHLFGLSECEVRREKNFDERQLKVPGYDLLLPTSWSARDEARVLLYVRSTLDYERLFELEQASVQSIWIRGGFRNGKKIVFCHTYREHTNSLGISLKDQRECLDHCLQQWKSAIEMKSSEEPCEVHICGDFNLDAYLDRWLHPSYYLYTVSKMVHAVCNLGNFSQLVTEPTRFQYNSLTGVTSKSCLDHVYTNFKYRCSEVTVSSFGNSDHQLISYVRYSKEPSPPARTIRKRSYKKFVANDFLNDLKQIDWTPVYTEREIDGAVDVFTRLFKEILDLHAPWVSYQERKWYQPWITDETKQLMKERDEAKSEAIRNDNSGLDSSDFWQHYKKLRNRVNNRLKFEEQKFKQDKMKENLGSPSKCWATAKCFMNWNSSSGPPRQLSIDGKLISKASIMASKINSFFLNKVETIQRGIQSVPISLSSCLRIMKGKQCKLAIEHVTVAKVLKLLKSLNNSKSLGIDELDNYSIKIAAEVIAQPLHHLITLSIMQCKFPSSWKYSKIIPLHKKASKF